MDELEQIKQDIAEIKERNIKVEADKAWETSLVRKVLITSLTYIIIVIFFIYLKFSNPYLTALVPTIGFVVSTLSIPIFKNIWLENFYRKKKNKD
ncbi:hypothetical protein COY62_02115 [bacterium (Candidatus Howlettbacteria) CG_4_10_14_0_8_um_filter_40_9]|nr:MAG: hypothetical protein COY62_02115 [bacterium (Candidatus Howlettbacteria) CG_4_10_14_0_8_um_filter_40_9]